MPRKVYIVGGDNLIKRMFEDTGDWVETKNLEEADVVQFTGGADVSPSLYREYDPDKTALCGNNPQRDLVEIGVFNYARSNDIPMAGICRGAQFLNVMFGGTMLPHIEDNRHIGAHTVVDEDGREILVSSTHHQLIQLPENGWRIFNNVIWQTADKHKDPEIFEISDPYDGECLALCCQPHPEYTGYPELTAWYMDYVTNELGG